MTTEIQTLNPDNDLNHKSNIDDIITSFKLKNQVGLASALTSYLKSGNNISGLNYNHNKNYDENFRIISQNLYEKCGGSAKSPWLEELIKNLQS
jgi:hypothetical protein